MILVIQIAAGIVLAGLVFRFWRQSLRAAIALLALGVVGLSLVFGGEKAWSLLAALAGAAIIREVQSRRRAKQPSVKNGPPPA